MSKITVKITEDDALEFLIKNYDESKNLNYKKNKMRFLFSLLFLILGVYFLFTGYQVKAIIFFVLSAVWFFIVPHYLRSAVIRTYRDHVKNKMGMVLNKPISYELNEKGIFVKYDLEEATYSYESIKSISRVGRNVYINHKGKVPLIIPYSNKKVDIDNFIESLGERLKKFDETISDREQST